jgi:thiosulfate/3-mercaptopyruvate sulfurtransferase
MNPKQNQTFNNGQYAYPEVLVNTDWVAEHLNDFKVRIIESNEDALLYDTGHIPGAVQVDWRKDLNDQTIRDYLDPEHFAQLASQVGITPETVVVFYGDKSNWWACYALWVFTLFGHKDLRILNGGRDKWIAEGRRTTKDKPNYPTTRYPVPTKRDNRAIRAFFEDTLAHSKARRPIIDVRSPGEFSGQLTHMPEYPQEGVLRGGHVPGAKSVPWKTAARDDGTFKSREELQKIYQDNLGYKPSDDTIVYCRIGERSSHTWFVLTKLLGFEKVRNYDGSWTEWGNMVHTPVEKP